MKAILHLCADTGSDTEPYNHDPNFTVHLVGSKIGVENFSLATWLNYKPQDTIVYGIVANPVCTEFSTARSNGKARNPDDGMFLVQECMRIIKEAQYWQWE